MKTLKSLKYTSIFQIIYCLYCLIPIFFIVLGKSSGIFTYTEIGTFLFCFVVINPTAIISFIINMSCFLAELKDSDQKKIIGLKWVWIFIWPIITTVFFITSGTIFTLLTGGV